MTKRESNHNVSGSSYFAMRQVGKIEQGRVIYPLPDKKRLKSPDIASQRHWKRCSDFTLRGDRRGRGQCTFYTKWRSGEKERLRKLHGCTTIAYAGQMLQFSVRQEAIDASYALNEPVAGSYDSDNH